MGHTEGRGPSCINVTMTLYLRLMDEPRPSLHPGAKTESSGLVSTGPTWCCLPLCSRYWVAPSPPLSWQLFRHSRPDRVSSNSPVAISGYDKSPARGRGFVVSSAPPRHGAAVSRSGPISDSLQRIPSTLLPVGRSARYGPNDVAECLRRDHAKPTVAMGVCVGLGYSTRIDMPR